MKTALRHRFPASAPTLMLVIACVHFSLARICATAFPSTWPQEHTVKSSPGKLTLSTAYYTIEHDFQLGGTIRLVHLTHGGATNLLAAPIQAWLRTGGVSYTDLNDRKSKVRHHREGLTEVVSVESRLMDQEGKGRRGLKLNSTYEYHWGYIKIHKEFVFGESPLRVEEISPVSTKVAGTLSSYGYREGTTEEEGAPAFSFGSCKWGKIVAGHPLKTAHPPRYVMLADPGLEGLEWFAGSDLWQWDLQLTGKRGQGEFRLQMDPDAGDVVFSVSPLTGTSGVWLTNSCAFDYYLSVPILEGHALAPWLHTSFNRNKGEWVSPTQVRQWAESGIQTVHCHNDGDYYDDGQFWRDGSYPPYRDMDKYDKVILDCHAAGLRVATYFSNKELHPSTREYQEHGTEWGRKNLKGALQHNFFRGTNEFGAQMCLRSGWLQFLEFSIDRVLLHHALDGVYYDWNVPLLCCNPAHEAGHGAVSSAHWDVDELLQLMEWTRRRLGPQGLVIIHNTTTPMFATENFANHIVANEWGYGKWSGSGPELKDLPLEWSLVGARSRGVISYGQLDGNSPKRLHRVFALQALLAGVTPWPASPETFELFPVLKPIGPIEEFKFADWRNDAVQLRGSRCAAAVYSREGEAYLVLANLHEKPDEVRLVLDPRKLPTPMTAFKSATLLSKPAMELDPGAMVKGGVQVTIPGDGVVLVRVRSRL